MLVTLFKGFTWKQKVHGKVLAQLGELLCFISIGAHAEFCTAHIGRKELFTMKL